MLYPKEHRIWDCELENISDFRPFWGGAHGLRPLSGKKIKLKYDRFGNQKLQDELGERKLISPKENLLK
jgi:hypothetical protein